MTIRSYWDHEEFERARMSAEDVEALLKFELMEKGIVAPTEPEMLPESGDVKKQLATTKVYVICAPSRYGDGPERTSVAFDRRDEADAFLALASKCVVDREYDIDSHFIRDGESGFSVEVMDLPTETDLNAKRSEIKRAKDARDENKRRRSAHDTALRECRDATSEIWDDWRRCIDEEAARQRIRDVWSQYDRDCEGDSKIALRFLRKAYSDDVIEDALPNLIGTIEAPVCEAAPPEEAE